ncbi:MAG: hypothetical protein HXY50_14280 [Ignavibacteriaceae bacterium]|nr:hypothetical protein [Ignavibacteriaceae bacterium]
MYCPRVLFYFFICLLFTKSIQAQSIQECYNNLKIEFKGEGKFEVGGPFVGIELHHSKPVLQRISFFYPAANSIDLSTDYWKRDTSFISSLALMIDDNFELIEESKYELEVTPFSIKFSNKNDKRLIEISYRFMKNKPAMIMEISITNLSSKTKSYKFLTHLDASLRTSHSFVLKDCAAIKLNEETNSIFASYEDSETQNVSLFSCCIGDKPLIISANGNPNFVNSNKSEYLKQIMLGEQEPQLQANTKPAFTYIYKKHLQSGEKFSLTKIIGSCKPGEEKDLIDYLIHNYKKEVEEYEESVLTKSCSENIIQTGDQIIDHSVKWAKSILETNVHYIDGDFVPMPCPAEYNFYFTHDVLLTDLAVVKFDCNRVKKDLKFIIKHADDNKTIPHAYYWKDSSYVTEYAGTDNWNHFWFIINCANYLKHTFDVEFLEELYPYIERSLSLVMTNKKIDDLVWAYQPDWWDIGSKFGPRAYMTILTIKAIRDYIFISSVLNKNQRELTSWENSADKIKSALVNKLWNEQNEYLMNFYEDGIPDPHFYTGSLLAAHLELLNEEKKRKLVNAAERHLLDPNVGIYNVFPMDFNDLQSYLDLQSNEAGEPFYYANGGVWPHGNSWYVLGLISVGKNFEALEFIKKNMSIVGIMNGPNGQPAMYEYRIAKKDDPSVYGVVDKPQFLWAAGWYLYSLYELFILDQNDWNLSLNPFMNHNYSDMQFTLNYYGKKKKILVDKKILNWDSISLNGKIFPTTILPAESISDDTIHVMTNFIPSLHRTEAVIEQIEYDESSKSLEFKLLAFPGHKNKTEIKSPFEIKKVLINNDEFKNVVVKKVNNLYLISFEFIHPNRETEIKIKF